MLDRLRQLGFESELLAVTGGGYVEPDFVRRRLRQSTLLVSVMHANNETGVLQPVHEIGKFLAETNALFHVDAAQTFGKEVESLKELRCDFLSISGHKIYGPMGVGALYVRRHERKRPPLVPLLCGGGQEMGLRPGTLPVPLVVGLGATAALAAHEYRERQEAAAQVKKQFLRALAVVDHRINGDPRRTQSHVLNVSFCGVDSEALMIGAPGRTGYLQRGCLHGRQLFTEPRVEGNGAG